MALDLDSIDNGKKNNKIKLDPNKKRILAPWENDDNKLTSSTVLHTRPENALGGHAPSHTFTAPASNSIASSTSAPTSLASLPLERPLTTVDFNRVEVDIPAPIIPAATVTPVSVPTPTPTSAVTIESLPVTPPTPVAPLTTETPASPPYIPEVPIATSHESSHRPLEVKTKEEEIASAIKAPEDFLPPTEAPASTINEKQNNRTLESQAKIDDNLSDFKENSTDIVPTKYRHSTDKVPTKYRQSTDKVPTKYRHSTDIVPTENRHNTDIVPTTDPTENRHNTDIVQNSFSQENIMERIMALRGRKLALLTFFYDYSVENNTDIINKVTYDALAKFSTVPIGSIRTTAKNLKRAGLIDITTRGKGPGTCVTIEIHPETIRCCVKMFSNSPNFSKISQKYRHSTDNRSDKLGPSSSSSYYLNKNTTTTSDSDGGHFQSDNAHQKEMATDFNSRLNEELESDIKKIQTPEILKKFNFGINIIKQVIEEKLCDVPTLQTSLNAFAFDIKENEIMVKKNILNPIGYFMGSIRRYKYYAPPANFISDEDKLIEEMIQRKETEATKLKDRKERLFLAEFQIWLNSLPETIKRQTQGLTAYLGDIHMAMLKQKFEEEYWPEMAKDLHL